MAQYKQVMPQITDVFEQLPYATYWLDLEFKILGINKKGVAATGARSNDALIGRKAQDLYLPSVAKNILLDFKQVVASHTEAEHEQILTNLATGEEHHFIAKIWPLLDNSSNKVIGLTVQMVDNYKGLDITHNTEQEQIFKYLDSIAEIVPAPFYWMNLQGEFIGLNNMVLQATGAEHKKHIIGKNVHELYQNKEIADKLQYDIDKVIRTGEMSQLEDKIVDVTTGKAKYYMATRTPLHNAEGKIIGVIGTSIESTAQREALQLSENEKIFKYLDSIAETIPALFYWMDLNRNFAGINDMCVKAVSAPNKEYIIGKNVHALYQNKEIADKLQYDIDKVIRTGEMSQLEDKIVDVTTGKIKYYMATRAPLCNSKDEIIGVIGTSIEITAEKEKERLELENNKNKAVIDQQSKFKEDVGHLAHDIKSPLDSLQSIIRHTNCLTESDRMTLYSVYSSIRKISQNIMAKYLDKDSELEGSKQEIITELALEQIIQEKTYQFQGYPLKLIINIKHNATPLFIWHNPTNFKRMMSNLIDNAAESIINNKNEDGLIELSLTYTKKQLTISVKDNGCGMSEDLQNNLLQQIQVTTGKENGHGIGFRQISDAVITGNGILQINSQLNQGTEILVLFPIVASPKWLVQEIKIGVKDIIVILDDDNSIHNLWDNRFKETLYLAPEIKIMNFRAAEMAFDYVNGLTETARKKVVLLADYELIHQKTTGLDIIQKLKMAKQSYLVTNHYNDPAILEQATACKVKLLPKALVNDVQITLDRSKTYQHDPDAVEKVDLLYLEPELRIIKKVFKLFIDVKIDHYTNTTELLNNIDNYPKKTRICLAYDLGHTTSMSLAIQLYKLGYTRITLLSSNRIKEELPPYLRVVKDDLGNFAEYLLGNKL